MRQNYNGTSVWQRRSFWHYCRDFEQAKDEAARYVGRSIFVGAYHQGGLMTP